MQINKHVHAIKVPFYITPPSGIAMERFVYVYLIYGSHGIRTKDRKGAPAKRGGFRLYQEYRPQGR